MDDFAVKYVGREHAEHHMAALKEDYEAVQWTGKVSSSVELLLIGTMATEQSTYLCLDMYVQAALHKFQHPMPNRQHDAPYKSIPPQYGTKVQLTDGPDNMP